MNTITRWVPGVGLARSSGRVNVWRRGALRAAVEGLENRTLLSAVIWTGAAGDHNWDTPGNWSSSPALPGASDDVTIPAGVTINHNQGSGSVVSSITSGAGDVLNLSGGSITVAAASTLVNFNLAGGTFVANAPVSMSGSESQWSSGYVNCGAGITFTNSGTLTLTGVDKGLNGGTLSNTGTILHGAGQLLLNNATISNQSLYDFQNVGTNSNIVGIGGTVGFNNTPTGTVRKSSGSPVNISVPFNSSAGATLDVEASTVTLNGGGTSTGATYNVAAGALLDLTGGTNHTFSGTYTGSGAGTVALSSGQILLNGPTDFDFPPQLFLCTGGAIGAGTYTLTNTGTMTLSGSGNKFFYNGTLENAGTMVHNAGLFTLNNANVSNHGTYDFRNLTTGANIVSNGGTVGFDNTTGALVRKSTGGGAVSISVPFNSSSGATVEVDTSSVTLNGGGTSTGATYSVATGSLLDLTGGSMHTLTGTYTGTGGGNVQFASGEIRVGATGATVNFPTGYFQWTGGMFNAQANTFTNSGSLTVTGFGNKVLNNGTLTNLGTIVHNAGQLSLNNATIDNRSIYDFRNVGPGTNIVGVGGTVGFNNAPGAVMRKSSGGGAVNFVSAPFNSSSGATIEVETSSVTLGGGGTSTGATYNVAAGALLDLTGGNSPTFTGTYTGSGGGNVSFASGYIYIGAGGATFNFPVGYFQWTGGTLNGQTNTLTNMGAMTLTGADKYFVNGTLVNAGTIVQNSGNLGLGNSTVSNQGIYDFQNLVLGADIVNAGGTVGFNNTSSGTVRKSSGGGTVSITVPFNGSAGGGLEVNTSIVVLSGGGTTTGATYNVAAGALLDLTGGNSPTFTGTYTGSGGGNVQLSSGNIYVGTGGATFSFPAGYFRWTGGNFNGQGNTLTNTGMITLGGDVGFANGTLLNNGTFVQNGGQLVLTNAAIDNRSIYDFQNPTASSIYGGGGTVNFNNASTGLMRKSAGGGSVSFTSVPFNNSSGTVEIDTASVTFSGGGTSTGGTYNVATSALLNLTGGTTHNLTGTYTGNGGGTIQFSGGQITVGAGGATFNFPDRLFLWSGGTLYGSGDFNTLTNAGYMTLAGGDKTLHTGTLDNQGVMIQTFGRLYLTNASLINHGVSDFQNTVESGIWPGGGTTQIANYGAVLKSAGNGVAYILLPYNSPGTTEVDAGSLAITSTVSQFAGNTLTGGTWRVSGGATLSTTAHPTIVTNQATVSLTGAGSTWTNVGSALASNSGALSLLGGNSLSITGPVSNTGSLTVGSGSTTSSGSSLTVSGAYTQSASGTFNVQIGGSAASGEYGSITAGGINLAGGFAGSLLNGFIPTPGDVYTVIHNTGGSALTTFAGLAEGTTFLISGVEFTISYTGGTGHDVVLTAGKPRVDLSISKTDGVTSVAAGGNTTYTIVVTNLGPSAVTNATVSDIFPAAISAASWSAVASAGSSMTTASGTGNIVDTVSLLSGGTVTFAVTATVSPAAMVSVSNTATVVAPSSVTDPNSANNSATDTDTVTRGQSSTITGTAGADHITLVQDPDHAHIDWIMGTATAQLPMNHVNGLTINGTGGNDLITLDYTNGNPLPDRVHFNGTFTIDGMQTTGALSGKILEIGQSTLYVNYTGGLSPAAEILAALATGYNGGAWNGSGAGLTGAFTSSPAAGGPSGVYGIGYADSMDGIVTAQPSNTVELRYTVMGDANLDRVVNSSDSILMARNYLVAGRTRWDQGNFNYDSTINMSDAQILQRNFNVTATGDILPSATSGSSTSGDPTGSQGSGSILDAPDKHSHKKGNGKQDRRR